MLWTETLLIAVLALTSVLLIIALFWLVRSVLALWGLATPPSWFALAYLSVALWLLVWATWRFRPA